MYREWYSYHFPELVKIVPDNLMYARVANFIGSRQDLTAEKLPELEDVVQDSAKAQAILDAAKVSMGELFVVVSNASVVELSCVLVVLLGEQCAVCELCLSCGMLACMHPGCGVV